MSLLSHFSAESLSEFLRRSNYWAKKNRNAYPIKIQKAVSNLYEWIDCPCNNGCECKKFQCEKHLVRKTGIDFNFCNDHFLECYVDSKSHDAIRWRNKSGRGRHAVEATDKIRNNWQKISAISSKTHLLCSNWCDPLYELMAREFKPSSETIYHAKWLSILCFDTFTAYDNGSVALLKRDFQNTPNFFSLMEQIRQDIIIHLENTGKTIQDFRQYDNPAEFFKKIPQNSPRPLGNIIDKLYLTL